MQSHIDLYVNDYTLDLNEAAVRKLLTVGEEMDDSERAVNPVDAPPIDEESVRNTNREEIRMIGSPGGGAVSSAT